jgi:hypothetical protein
MERTKMLKDIQTVMQMAQGFDCYLAVLPVLLDIAAATVDDPALDVDRMNEMAGYLAEIRFLLDEIDRYAGPQADSLAVLRIAERYRELEGTLKELRNDRSPARS